MHHRGVEKPDGCCDEGRGCPTEGGSGGRRRSWGSLQRSPSLVVRAQVVQAGNLIPAEEDGSVPRRPKELNCRGGEDAAATPLLDRTSRNKEKGAVGAQGDRTHEKDKDTFEQGLDHEKVQVAMERGDGVSTAAAGEAAEAGGIRDRSRDDEAAANDEEENDDEDEEDNDDDDDEEDASNGFLQLTATRRVPNCCAVCLSGYEVGERVVWSPNRKCRHAFHRDCIVDWFVKMPDDGTTVTTATTAASAILTPCPCCRRDFTDLEAYRREKRIRWSAEYAFNPNFITFR
jgi:RING-like zinc finger